MVNIYSCEMIDFNVAKCDLFYSREAWLSIKMLREMRNKKINEKYCNHQQNKELNLLFVPDRTRSGRVVKTSARAMLWMLDIPLINLLLLYYFYQNLVFSEIYVKVLFYLRHVNCETAFFSLWNVTHTPLSHPLILLIFHSPNSLRVLHYIA